MLSNKIFVAALPRSRTAWFAAYFNALGARVQHELLDGLYSKQEFYDAMQNVDGNSDCGLVFTNFQEKFPDSKTIVVHRNPRDVAQSLKAIGMPTLTSTLGQIDFKLRYLDGLHVRYEDIDARLPEITEFAGLDYDPMVADTFANMVITEKHTTGDAQSLAVWMN